MKQLIDALYHTQDANREALHTLIAVEQEEHRQYLYDRAFARRQEHYGNRVYARALIEFSNRCANTCTYCGISIHNQTLQRYRMRADEIVAAAQTGYALGFRTVVLQGGEDKSYSDAEFCTIINQIRTTCPDSSVTLSIGERSRASYQQLYDAGADRFLLRHETINPSLYARLHPGMSFERRIQALYDLKEIGYQVGTGFMVGVPGQTTEDLADDLRFIKELAPHMVGIGPFIPHEATIHRNEPHGSAERTYTLIALIRLLLPSALIPATTSLATLNPNNRYKGFACGANVVMPNLTPHPYKEQYQLYNGKRSTDTESYEVLSTLKQECLDAGFVLDMARGDNKEWRRL